MTALCVIGAGGHGKVVADCADATGRWDRIAFLDDGVPAGTVVGRWPVITHTDDAASLVDSHPQLVVALGDNKTRVDRLAEYRRLGFELVSMVHPRAYVSASVMLGEGTVVLAQAAVNCDASIGAGVIINTGASVDHDCKIGKGVHLSPGVHLAGSVVVGDYSWIGIGANVIQSIEIGSNALVGAGAAVIRDVASGRTVVGIPARPVDEE